MTADEAMAAIQDRDLSVARHRTNDLRAVFGPDGGRLSKWWPTVIQAVEEAVARLSDGELRTEDERYALAFRRLMRGVYFQRSREVAVTDPDTGEPAGTKKVWDIHRTTDNFRFVQGEDTLLKAVIKAEQVIASQG